MYELLGMREVCVKMEVERLSRCNEEVMASVEEREGGLVGENVECNIGKEEKEDGGGSFDFKAEGAVVQPRP